LLTIGLPGCGKTTAARRFEGDHDALRLTKDEWMKTLYGAENPSSASDVIEGRFIAIPLRAGHRNCHPVELTLVSVSGHGRRERLNPADDLVRSGSPGRLEVRAFRVRHGREHRLRDRFVVESQDVGHVPFAGEVHGRPRGA
jgi:predicted kinase